LIGCLIFAIGISPVKLFGDLIPAWYCLDCNPDIKINFLDKNKNPVTGFYKDLKDNYSFKEIKTVFNLWSRQLMPNLILITMKNVLIGHSHSLLQETDTFDTWFLSGQWPLSTLGF